MQCFSIKRWRIDSFRLTICVIIIAIISLPRLVAKFSLATWIAMSRIYWCCSSARQTKMTDKDQRLILWFDQIDNADVALVGGKNASLGEMYSRLTSRGIRVHNGFAVTALAYQKFIENNRLTEFIDQTLKDLDTGNLAALQKCGAAIRNAIAAAELPGDLIEQLGQAYRDLSNAYHLSEADVAVRSSATAEDLPGASFAGEHETYLNVVGEEMLVKAVKLAMASLFNDRAISYRVDKGFEHSKVALSVGVQKMVRAD